ncbi:MAG: DUF4785 family protein [Methylococcaceae bacterium]|nr:DUF4785 family protein [Methylococcaceae bacterium]
MKKSLNLIALALLAAAPVFADSTKHLASPQEGDIVPSRALPEPAAAQAQAAVTPHAAGAATTPIAAGWKLDHDSKMDIKIKPFVAKSVDYSKHVNATELAAGTNLVVSTPNAVVRINPAPDTQDGTGAIEPEFVRLKDKHGRVFHGSEGMDKAVSDEQIRTAKVDVFAPGTSMFRLKKELGAGEVTMTVDALTADPGKKYVVNVHEKDSPYVLQLNTDRDAYVSGDTVTLSAHMRAGQHALPIQEISGVLTAPTGKTIPLSFDHGRASVSVEAEPSTDLSSGLWRADVTVVSHDGKLAVRRDASTAFAVAWPSARLSGTVDVTGDAKQITANVKVETAAAGRYEVRGMLFGTDKDGTAKPIAVAHAGAWLEPGEGQLGLSFQRDAVQASGLVAPFSVMDLRLIRQDRLMLLQRQQLGFDVELP